MTRLFAALVAIAATFGLAGCAALNTVNADLSTWGEWPTGRQPGTYAFERLPSQEARADETGRLEAAARPALEKAGFKPAAAGAAPDVIVQVAARLTRTAPDLWADPIWWRGGFGHYRRSWAGPLWVIDPRFDSTRYDREVALLLRDGASGKPLYEARVSNEGATTGSESLLKALFQGALVDFPRTGPNPRTVSVTLE